MSQEKIPTRLKLGLVEPLTEKLQTEIIGREHQARRQTSIPGRKR